MDLHSVICLGAPVIAHSTGHFVADSETGGGNDGSGAAHFHRSGAKTSLSMGTHLDTPSQMMLPDAQPEESAPPTPKFSTPRPAETAGGLDSTPRATPSPPVPSKELRDSVYFRSLGCN